MVSGALLWKVRLSKISKPALYYQTSLLKSVIKGWTWTLARLDPKDETPISKIRAEPERGVGVDEEMIMIRSRVGEFKGENSIKYES